MLRALSDHVLRDKKMDASRIKAAEVLLNKALPNLQSGELHVSGNPLSALYDMMAEQPAPTRKTNGHAGNGADPHG